MKIISKKNKLIMVVLAMVFTACRSRHELSTKIFPYSHETFHYPEEIYLKDKQNVGLAFSGGGSRAAALATGQLRALNKLGLLKHVKYISAVSGGAWATTCYTYSDLNNTELLGEFMSPQQLHLKDVVSSPNGKLVGCISNGKIFAKFLGAAITGKGDETFSRILYRIYLKPLGLGERRTAAYDKNNVSELCARNSKINKLKASSFYLVNANNRPYLILSGTIIGDVRNTNHLPSIHMEMTPLYSGATYFNLSQKKTVGGGYAENIGIDRRFITKISDSLCAVRWSKHKSRAFTLSDMMAISGNAPGTIFYKNHLFTNVGLPEIRLWSPYLAVTANNMHKVKSKEYAVGDGGNLENLGLIPLLKRKVENIVVFVNSLRPIELKSDSAIDIDSAIPRVFGVDVKGKYNIETGILNNDSLQYKKLVDTLFKLKKAGQSIIYTGNFSINPKPDYGIFTGPTWNTVQITWVYNDNFEPTYTTSQLNDSVRSYYYNKGFDSFNHHFPHLPTFLTSRRLRGVEYEVSWANMLAHFSSWVVYDNRSVFNKAITGKHAVEDSKR